MMSVHLRTRRAVGRTGSRLGMSLGLSTRFGKRTADAPAESRGHSGASPYQKWNPTPDEQELIPTGTTFSSRDAKFTVVYPPSRAQMARIYIKTYGCQMNERDSEQVAQMLVARGHVLTSEEEDADVVLLNTCSVRDLAEQKALGKMGMLGALSRQRPVVYGFLGCMAQSRGESLLKSVPHLNLVVGTQKFHRVAEYVDQALSQQATQAQDFGG